MGKWNNGGKTKARVLTTDTSKFHTLFPTSWASVTSALLEVRQRKPGECHCAAWKSWIEAVLPDHAGLRIKDKSQLKLALWKFLPQFFLQPSTYQVPIPFFSTGLHLAEETNSIRAPAQNECMVLQQYPSESEGTHSESVLIFDIPIFILSFLWCLITLLVTLRCFLLSTCCKSFAQQKQWLLFIPLP